MNGNADPGFESLLRREAERTRGDLSRKLGQAERALLPLAGAGLVVLFGVQLLAAAGVLLLARVMPAWLAAVLLGASAVCVGAILMATATRRTLGGRERGAPAVGEEKGGGERERAA